MTGGRIRYVPAALILVSAVVAMTSFTGCAKSGASGPGSDLIRAGRYDEAVTVLTQQVADHPNDARSWRNLGIARFRAGDAKAAVSDLEHARSLNGRDPATLLFLGRAAETNQDYGQAATAYQAYLDLKPSNVEVRTRLRETNLKKLRAELEAAIQREKEIANAQIPENTIAVMEFANLSDSPELAPLGKGLSAMVTGDLAKVHRFQIVEREKIPILMQEIKLGTSTVEVRAKGTSTPIASTRGVQERLMTLKNAGGRTYFEGPADGTESSAFTQAVRDFQKDHALTADGKVGPKTRAAIGAAYDSYIAQGGTLAVPAMDRTSAPRAGKLLGARVLVQGGYAGSLTTPLRIDAGMTESTTGEAKGSGADAGGPLADLFRMEKEIVYELLNTLDVKLTGEEKDAIGRLPTSNVNAFLAWSQGLDYEDRGQPDLARQSFERAVRLDPGFREAHQSLDAVSGTTQGFSSLEQTTFEQTLAQGGGEAGGAAEPALQARLDQGTANVGWGLAPGRAGDSGIHGDQLNPIVAPVGAAGGTGTVVITGEVPR